MRNRIIINIDRQFSVLCSKLIYIIKRIKCQIFGNQRVFGHGKLTIYIDDDTVSYERLSEILLDIRRIFDDSGVKFYVIDCVLEYQKNEDSSKKKEGRVEVREFLYADIYEEGMVERVKASDEEAKAYYAEQDAEKLKEIEENK